MQNQLISATMPEHPKQNNSEELKQQITVLSEWRSKAIVQLEYFRIACTLYNFYDAKNIMELLTAPPPGSEN